MDLQNKQYLKELQIFSGIAILLVVASHASFYYWILGLGMNTVSKEFSQMSFLTKAYLVVLKLPVPMFIFIAGYKFQLTGMPNGYLEFARKRLIKVFKPFLVFSLLLLLLVYAPTIFKRLLTHDQSGALTSIVAMIKAFARIFKGYNIAYQLWYVPMYLLIVLSYPFILRIVQNRELKILVFALSAVIVAYFTVAKPSLVAHPNDFVYYYCFYYLGGMYQRNTKFTNSKYIARASIMTYIFLVIMAAWAPSYILNQSFIQISIPIGVLAFYYLSCVIKGNAFFNFLGEQSFVIFLFHEPTMKVIVDKIMVHTPLLKSALSVVILTFCAMLLSIIFNQFIRRTPLNALFFQRNERLPLRTLSS